MRKAALSLFLGLLAVLPAFSSRFGGLDPVGSTDSFEAREPDQGPVALVSQLSHATLLAGEPQDVYVCLSLRAAELPQVERLGMNLALVIDRSGSMASEDKLRFAKSAAEQLVGRLRPDDQLSLVTYDDRISTLVPSTPACERSVFLEAIRSIESGNSTDLHGGMVRGYDQVLQHLTESRLNRVLLISDGLANTGVTEPSEILASALQCRESGVRISTMGMGLDYDEDLLSGIAQYAGGNYYYVDQAESVGRHLDREIDGMSKIVARDLSVTIELGAGVELAEVFGYPHSLEGRVVVVPVSDMVSAERRKIVLRLRVQGVAPEVKTLARATLGFRAAASEERQRLQNPALMVAFSEDVEAVERARNPAVLVKVEVVLNAVALDAAMRLQKEGCFQAAQELLAARYLDSKTINDTELKSAEVTRILSRMRQVMLELERTRSDPLARRDLQLSTQLRALGYASGD